MNINGNHNIVIQNVNDSTITLEIDGEIREIRNDIAEMRGVLQRFDEKQFWAMFKQIFFLRKKV